MSQLPFSCGDYSDGEIHKLEPSSRLWRALFEENWRNCDDSTKQYYLDRLNQPHHFSGTVISIKRSQIELTYIPRNELTGGAGNMEIIAITLENVARFVQD